MSCIVFWSVRGKGEAGGDGGGLGGALGGVAAAPAGPPTAQTYTCYGCSSWEDAKCGVNRHTTIRRECTSHVKPAGNYMLHRAAKGSRDLRQPSHVWLLHFRSVVRECVSRKAVLELSVSTLSNQPPQSGIRDENCILRHEANMR
jgi:hypothetical protein